MNLQKILLALILLLGIALRFNNLNWDSNFHLHPDERFLTMVAQEMRLPSGLRDYLTPGESTFNPHNLNFEFFVYGTFPLILTKLIAITSNFDGYNEFTLLGRAVSAFADTLVIVLVYLTAGRLADLNRVLQKRRQSIALWAAFIYAVAVLPLQLSHFFAVDTFLNLFMFGSFYFILHSQKSKIKNQKSKIQIKIQIIAFLLSAISLGLGMASKITAIFILPLNLFTILIFFRKPEWVRASIQVAGYLLIVYFTVHIANPYYFASANLLDPTPNAQFIQNIKTLESFGTPDAWYPPGVQWLERTPVVYALINLVIFGLGVVPAFLAGIGILSLISKIKDQKSKLQIKIQNFDVKRYTLYAILFWLIAVFLYQSTRFSYTMRYFLPLYPFLAIFTGIGASQFFNSRFSILKSRKIRNALYPILIASLLLWPVAFSSIYLEKHSRVTASEWIYENIKPGSLILAEHWDDALPLPIDGRYGEYRIEQLPVFDPDTPEKWRTINDLLEQADYYVLSSNRAWGSIGRVPKRYPRTSEFYKSLFNDQTQYKLVKSFRSHPQLSIFNYRLAFDDSWAEEAFTVYDHPVVLIFQKSKIKDQRLK